MLNKQSILGLLVTTVLLLAPTVNYAQDTNWFNSNEGEENDGWLEDRQNTTNNEVASVVSKANIAQEALAAHNRYRAEVEVSALQWSDILTNSSQQWANELAASGTFQHSDVQGVGENIWMGSSGGFSVTQMVDRWGAEQQFFTPGVFPDVSTTGNWNDVGHYTQIVWRNTTEVGCALASGNGKDYFVCQYSPQGNFQGQAVY